jgi:hypothetical protein
VRACCRALSLEHAALLTVRFTPLFKTQMSELAATRMEGTVVGSHLLVMGRPSPPKAAAAATGAPLQLVATRVSDLSASPNRESLWHLEVVELWRDVFVAGRLPS